MLDEPTNHLDMHSCDLLIDALNKYEGSLILVSHDRYFIAKTANKIWEIENHKVKEFKGGYEEWVAWKERMAKLAAAESRKPAPDKARDGSRRPVDSRQSAVNSPGNSKKIEKSQESGSSKITENKSPGSAPINKEQKKELQKQQRIFQQLEEKIAILNSKKTELESSLVDPAIYSDKLKFQEAEKNLHQAETELATLNKQYEEAFEMIMKLDPNGH